MVLQGDDGVLFSIYVSLLVVAGVRGDAVCYVGILEQLDMQTLHWFVRGAHRDTTARCYTGHGSMLR